MMGTAKDLINEKLLTSIEKKYLFNYNMEIYRNISKFLTKNERVEEIARILGGAKVTENTRIHASELISLAND